MALMDEAIQDGVGGGWLAEVGGRSQVSTGNGLAISVEPALTRSSRISNKSARSWVENAVSPQSSSTMSEALAIIFENLM